MLFGLACDSLAALFCPRPSSSASIGFAQSLRTSGSACGSQAASDIKAAGTEGLRSWLRSQSWMYLSILLTLRRCVCV